MKLKNAIRKSVLRVNELASFYRPFTPAELDVVQTEAVRYSGDKPRSAGPDNSQFRVEFRLPRVPLQVSNLTYTSRGMSWVDGVLHEKYSLRGPSIKESLSRPSLRGVEEIARGTVIQCETPWTYGDWVSEFLCTLTTAMPLASPLLVPQSIMSRPYVRRDLAKLPVEILEVVRPIHVREATILPKARPGHYVTPDEVVALRKAFQISPVPPRPGSMLYVSREGETGDLVDRAYPSKQVGEVLTDLGVKVVLAKDTSQEQFQALAQDAETVIGDHGAAMFNMLFWQPRRVIELFTHSWWTSCFLFLADSMSIRDYSLIDIDDFSAPAFRQKIAGQLASAPVPD